MSTKTTLFDPLFQTLILRSDADELLDRLDEAGTRLFQAGASFDDVLAELFTPVQKRALLALFAANSVQLTELSAVEAQLREVKEALVKIPVLELTLAIEPSEKLLIHVQDWVSENVEMKVLIETRTKRDLIGGLMISLNGYYHDYSIAKLLHTS